MCEPIVRCARALVPFLFLIPVVAAGQVAYTDGSTPAGILPSDPPDGNTKMAMGVLAADYDDDGLVDLFVPNDDGAADQLYHNLGGGLFDEVAEDAGVDLREVTLGGLFLDYDGDHDLDLLTTHETGTTAFRLYRQDAPGEFVVVTGDAGLNLSMGPKMNAMQPLKRSGACAGDINNDSYLDLCVTTWNGQSRLFRNQKNGTFTEITAASGLSSLRHYWQPIMADFNGDGWLDIYMAVDFEANQLWINQKNGTFVDVAAAAGVANLMNDMGATLGDYDNDGDLDLYLTNIYEIDFILQVQENNVLYRNNSVGETVSFSDESFKSQVADGRWGWGATFLDADRDGWVDIAATNGWGFGAWIIDSSKFYRNPGEPPFVFANESNAFGFNDTFWGSSLVAFDFDRDGDLDMVQARMDGPTRLLKNTLSGDAASRHYLTVRPRMNGPNYSAIGAIVRVSAGGLNQMRLISAGMSCMGQEPAEAFFGLGAATAVDSLTVEWPDGTETVQTYVAADQMHTIQHGGFGDLDADGDIDNDDMAIFWPCYTGPTGGGIIYAGGCRAADVDGQGDVDCDDYQVVKQAFIASSGFTPTLPLQDFVNVLTGVDLDPGRRCMADMNASGQPDQADVGPYVSALLTVPPA